MNIKRQTNIFCNVSIVHEYVIPIATGETGVDGLAKSSTDRLISRHIPGIGQNDFLACTSGRCAFALLHSHQVADVGQHRLEVRHFPRWSLNFWTWKTAHPGAVSSSTLGSLAGCVVLTVATPGTMRPTPTFWSNDRRAPMFARLTASFRICARFPAREPLRAQREVNDTPSEHNTLTRATVYRSRGRHNIDLQHIRPEYFIPTRTNEKRASWREFARDHSQLIRINLYGESTPYRLTATELESLEPARTCALIGGSLCLLLIQRLFHIPSDVYRANTERILIFSF